MKHKSSEENQQKKNSFRQTLSQRAPWVFWQAARVRVHAHTILNVPLLESSGVSLYKPSLRVWWPEFRTSSILRAPPRRSSRRKCAWTRVFPPFRLEEKEDSARCARPTPRRPPATKLWLLHLMNEMIKYLQIWQRYELSALTPLKFVSRIILSKYIFF